MMWSLVAGCGLALMLLVTGAGGQTCQTTGPNFVCLKCNSPFVLNAGACQSAAASTCPSNCAACPKNNSVCETCNSGYRLKAGACELCQAKNCKVCHATCIDRCEECLSGFRRNKDYKCERCNGMCSNCTTSAAGCDTCGLATYQDFTATCATCTDANCQVCTAPSTCVVCNGGYFLSGASCTQCVGGCLACTSATTCSQCPAGQYWDSTAKTCTACASACQTNKCDLNNKCTACNPGYFVNAGDCTQVTQCKVVDASGKCTTCNDNYKLDGGVCSPCLELTAKECHMCVENNRRRLWTGGLCKYCPTNCNKCNTTTNCQSCMPDYIWNTTTSTCQACPTADSTLTQAECALCSKSYWDTTCKVCTSADQSTATGCQNCKGLASIQNCTSCSPLPTGGSAQTQCGQCASAKTGIYWTGSACAQYNCSDVSNEAECAACGVSNQLVRCRECPTNSSHLTTPAECEQCKNYKYVGSSCIDTTKVNCAGNLTSNDEATCLYCNSQFWNTDTGSCQVCPGSGATSCAACPGYYWDGSACQTIDCNTATLSAEPQCTACNYNGKYWDGSACIDVNCTTLEGTTVQGPCDACDGYMWNSTDCLVATPGDISTQESCGSFKGRVWNGSLCYAVAAMIGPGQTLPTEVADGSVQSKLPPLYRNLATMKYEPAVCNEFATVEECSKCTGQYWDSMNSKCKAVDCSGSLTTAATCNACPKRYWATTCQTVPTCSTSLGSQAECGACRFENYYWDGTCKRSNCQTVENVALENECNACEGVYWNGTICAAATLPANFTASQELCEGSWTRVFVNGACKFTTSKPGETLDSDINSTNTNTPNPYVIIGGRYFDDSLTVYRLPDAAAAATVAIAENWCKNSARMYGLNRYWAAAAAHTDCKDVATTACATTTAAAAVRDSNPTLCGKCPGYIWDSTTFTCRAVDCTNPSSIKSSADCDACGQGYAWEKYLRLGYTCRKLTCSSALLGSTARCAACSTTSSPQYLQSSLGCYACPTKNCDECTSQGCTKCKFGYVLDEKTNPGTCTACTGGQVYDPENQMCKTCPSNCLLCSSSTVCTNCKPGYILRGGKCEACAQSESDCRDCKSATTSQGSRWDAAASPSCISCPAACTVCTATACTKCLDGFYLEGGVCKSCKVPKLLKSKEQCLKCFPETYFDTAATGCKDCLVLNCKTCTANDKCTECFPGRFFNSSTMKCELCSDIDAQCTTCENTEKCTACNTNYYLYNSGSTCVAQDTMCITMADNVGCTLCKDGYYITGATCTKCQTGCAKCSEGSSCMTCEANYFMTPLRTCAKCIDNCDACECNAKCDQCASGYCFNVDTLECVATSLNCKDCEGTGTNLKCITCANKYVKNVCPACSAACVKCTDATTCTECQQGFLLSAKACTACTDTNCKVCTASDCTTCKDNYFKSNGTCTQCGSNCKTCTNATSCDVCFGGYSLSGGACSLCTANCNDCMQECTVCADTSYEPDTVTKQCVLKPTPAPTAAPSNSPPSHQVALTTLLMTLLLATMIII